MDALLDMREIADLAGLKGGPVVSECVDVDIHGITGQRLPLSLEDFEEHPKCMVAVVVFVCVPWWGALLVLYVAIIIINTALIQCQLAS